MKFNIILHLRKKAEKEINRAMRAAESGNDLEAARLFMQAGEKLITLAFKLRTEFDGNKTEIH
ncbi:TPA: hypothetical protein I8P16_000877 [Salmonella enterica subsp. enterica serovar Napoli]|nr:hypothetical protein [Salmonella enterica subsp. enterica serovar Mikawasima]EID1816825.1 hypothetical protein [Salmonella enterica subsp. enterica serovar Mikawasima]HBB6981317.1 hypothetical protein [Salmonella enterica subsp. enterica serovar Napoli]